MSLQPWNRLFWGQRGQEKETDRDRDRMSEKRMPFLKYVQQ